MLADNLKARGRMVIPVGNPNNDDQVRGFPRVAARMAQTLMQCNALCSLGGAAAVPGCRLWLRLLSYESSWLRAQSVILQSSARHARQMLKLVEPGADGWELVLGENTKPKP